MNYYRRLMHFYLMRRSVGSDETKEIVDRIKMSMKKYIVYGTGINAVKFLLEYGLGCIDFFIKEKKELKEFYGKPVLSLSNMIWDKAKMIVVASSDAVYFQIKQDLEQYGFSEFSDFIYYRLLNKKIACIYGNCHTAPIRKGLELSKEFNNIYGFYSLKQIQQMQLGGGLIKSGRY